METEKQKKKFYSTPMKVLTVLLTFAGILMCALFGGAVLSLGSLSGSDPFALDENTSYQDTEGCGDQMVWALSRLSVNLENRARFDVNGSYNPDRLVDIMDTSSENPDENTSYSLEKLYEIYISGAADQLLDLADTSRELNAQENTENAAEEGNTYSISESTWDHLQSAAGNTQFSDQFLYLYEYGRQVELETGMYTAAGETLADYAAKNSDTVSLYELYSHVYQAALEASDYMWALENISELQNSNFCYYITDGTRTYTNVVSWSNADADAVGMQAEAWPMHAYCRRESGRLAEDSYFPETRAGYRIQEYLSANPLLSENETVYIGLQPGYPVEDDYRSRAETFDNLIPRKNLFLALAVAGIVIAIGGLTAGTFQSGRNPENREIRLYAFDKLPSEVGGAVGFLAVLMGLGLAVTVYGSYGGLSPTPLSLVLYSLAVVGDTGFFLLLYYALVRRIKAHNIWEKSLLRAVILLGKRAYAARKASTRVIWAGIVLILLHFLVLPSTGFFGFLLCLVVDILVLLYLLRDAAGKQTVEEGLKQIGAGNLDYKVDTTELRGDNLELAQMINSMGDSLKESVDMRMKNERMQADLITNVSHDLKTPLTSIINYVDLLKRENIEDPKIKNYIEILERKSQRLKQLAEDLVEASRASSGNVKLEIVTLNLNELVQQVNGEFSERFSGRDLELICHLPLGSTYLHADGRYIWRVLENLYGNAAKYSMPSTRVYVDVVKKAGMVMFSIKNVSEQTLNISADELMERFVRGDTSRTTEGSGLGLSIARNLVTLMGGTFELYVDGDLFKAIITFPEAGGRQSF